MPLCDLVDMRTGVRSAVQLSQIQESIRAHILMYNFLAVFFLSFLWALDLSYFTSKTPHKDQQVKYLLIKV